MANLIITIISIALVAVAALMGAYYGGNAFLAGQAKAKANTVANAFQQVDAAIQLYNTQNSMLTASGAAVYLTGSLVPQYLNPEPLPGVPNARSGKISLAAFSPMTKPVLFTYLDDANVCNQLEAMRTGILAATRNFAGYNSTSFTGRIGCVFDNGNSWESPTKYYVAYYALYGTP